MQSVEEFMQDFFGERLALEQQEAITRIPFRKKFYADGTQYGSRERNIEVFKAEKIQSISTSAGRAYVITITEVPKGFFTRRYGLQLTPAGWQISEIELCCQQCRGKEGNNDCPQCQGRGWVAAGC